MSTTLDPETGLAKVYEQFYWEVKENYEYYSLYEYGGKFFNGYEVKLIEKIWIEGHYTKLHPWYYFGFGKKHWVEGMHKPVTRIARIVNKNDTGEMPGKDGEKFKSYSLTKEAIVKVSVELWEKYLKEERAKELTKSLLGQYPPKSVKGL